jgi:hypothetical protein
MHSICPSHLILLEECSKLIFSFSVRGEIHVRNEDTVSESVWASRHVTSRASRSVACAGVAAQRACGAGLVTHTVQWSNSAQHT